MNHLDYYDKLRDQAAIEIAAVMTGAVATHSGSCYYGDSGDIIEMAVRMADDLVHRLRDDRRPRALQG